MLGRVFDLFAQVEGSLDRARGGLGIGLTLAKTLIEMHGGRIEARSEGHAKGSEFIVTLPVASYVPAIAVGKALPQSDRVPLAKRKVLVVDDMRDAGYVLGKLLESLGQEVHTMRDGPSALDYARRELPDVVFSDIGMPIMDGYELARRFREEPSLNGVVLVALTGYGQETDRQHGQQAGFDRYLVKPANIEVLYDLLASLPVRPKADPTCSSEGQRSVHPIID